METTGQREEAFAALVRAVAEPLTRYAHRRTDPATADDVVAETLTVLWRRFDDVPTDDPLPWTYAVARRCLANARRGGDRRRALEARLRATAVEPAGEDDGDRDADRLAVALLTLPPRDQELLRLWAWEGLEAREIATVLGISANAAAIRLHRAKRRLSERMGVRGTGGSASGRKSGTSGGQTPVERRESR
ncbi:RNA polymerase sigma factor [Nocardioides sp.]|uniref:RNA polymerase sigma factor n=1 Tax=Nocardioides sp. TaxID=35761 RepID=UPI003518F195